MIDRVSCSLLAALSLCACSSPPTGADVSAWQSQGVAGVDSAQVSVAEVDALRERRDLRVAWEAAWQALGAKPTPEALWRMARAEADMVAILWAGGSERRERDVVASSALEFAQRAAEASQTAEVLAQLAYSLGMTTHLVPMFDRDVRAQETLAVIERALALDPAQPTALVTLATLHLRLETLPWIAKLFAGDAPEPDLELAERSARTCVESRPSREHRLLLAKILLELDRVDEARELLRKASMAGEVFPRDREFVGPVRRLLGNL